MSSPRGRRILFVASNASIDRLHVVERLELGVIHRPDRVVALPGGKGLNAARAAAALGASVRVVAIVGGRAGEWIADRLAALQIEAVLIRTEAETRTCLSILDRSTGDLTEFYEPGESIDVETWRRFEEAISAELDRDGIGAVVMSGSLPPAAPQDGYARIVRRAIEQGVTSFVDAHGHPLELAVGAGPSVVKVNAAEAMELTGVAVAGPPDALRAANSIAMAGAETAVVTLGSDGAIVLEAGEARLVRGPATRGDYPVGSGDAFLGGLVASLVDGATLIDASRLAIGAGIANALRPGAGALDPAVARRLVEEVVFTDPD